MWRVKGFLSTTIDREQTQSSTATMSWLRPSGVQVQKSASSGRSQSKYRSLVYKNSYINRYSCLATTSTSNRERRWRSGWAIYQVIYVSRRPVGTHVVQNKHRYCSAIITWSCTLSKQRESVDTNMVLNLEKECTLSLDTRRLLCARKPRIRWTEGHHRKLCSIMWLDSRPRIPSVHFFLNQFLCSKYGDTTVTTKYL